MDAIAFVKRLFEPFFNVVRLVNISFNVYHSISTIRNENYEKGMNLPGP